MVLEEAVMISARRKSLRKERVLSGRGQQEITLPLLPGCWEQHAAEERSNYQQNWLLLILRLACHVQDHSIQTWSYSRLPTMTPRPHTESLTSQKVGNRVSFRSDTVLSSVGHSEGCQGVEGYGREEISVRWILRVSQAGGTGMLWSWR